jgi:hypothetical protein
VREVAVFERCLMKMWYGYVATLLIVTASLAQEHTGAQEHTEIFTLRQLGCPAILTRQNPIPARRGHFLALKNIGNTMLRRFRIGWIIVYPDGQDEIGFGSPDYMPFGVEPGKTVSVPLGVSLPRRKARPDGLFAIGFFIAEVHTQTGTVWKTWPRDIEEQVLLRMASTSAP